VEEMENEYLFRPFAFAVLVARSVLLSLERVNDKGGPENENEDL